MMNVRRSVVALAVVTAACSDGDEELASETSAIESGPVVVINEFLAGSSGRIELFNAGDATANLSGWQVDDIANGGYAPKNLGTAVSLAPGAYLVVTYAGVNTASADEVRLLDTAGVVSDRHSNNYAGTSTAGLCFGRQPDGGAWAGQSLACSLGSTNGCPTTGACDDGNPCTTGEQIQTTCSCGGGVPVSDGTSCGDGYTCVAGGCTAVQTPDAAIDAAPDAAPDAPIDAAPDAPIDAAPDAPIDAAPDAPIDAPIDAPPAPPHAELLAMPRRDRVLLQGVVVTPTGAFQGEVLVEGDTIVCVAPSCSLVEQSVDAAIVRTNGVILPGLIDAHNHILFDIFDETDWSPSKIYANHNQWPNEARYKALVDTKQYMNGESSPMSLGCEMLKYGELKALVAGTTSVQGSANPADKACYASLARTIDQSPNGLGFDKIQAATLFPTKSAADGVCNNIASDRTDAYAIHIAEGVDATSRNEFAKLGTITTNPQCLYAPETTIIHGTSLGDPELSTIAARGMSMVWSPRSNVFLYGGGNDLAKTANIPLALQKGINVALAPDWSIGGSQNLLDELRFADLVDNNTWGNVLSARQLVDMVTINAARALGLASVLGSIEVGKKADLMVIGGAGVSAYDSLLAARPADVRLVMVNGAVLYGDAAVSALGAGAVSPGCESLDICGSAKFACVAQANGTATNKLGQTYADITGALDNGLASYDAMNLSVYDFAPITPLVRCESAAP